jgi:protein translocase SecG subunit
MMGLFLGLLTLILVLDCVVLVFLVLIQLPKKEAGAGLAFGGAATDALFGAGSGNVLTKVTKYSAGVFFVLALLLSAIQSYRYQNRTGSGFEQKLNQSGQPFGSPSPLAPASAPQAAPGTTPTTPATVPPAGTGAVVRPQVEQPTASPATAPTTPAAPSATPATPTTSPAAVPATNAAPAPAPK